MKQIELSDHFDFKKLLRFVIPTITMMIFTSVYGVVDGIFVSRFAGETAFAALNFIAPVVMIYSAVGFMIGTGGSALVSKALGEGDKDRANRYFSMLIFVIIIAGAILTAISELTLRPTAVALAKTSQNATAEMIEQSVIYGAICEIGLIPFMLQNAFQSFFVTAEKPKLGLFFTITAGVSNAILDALFVGVFRWGLIGAAAATVAGQVIGGILPIIYFARKNTSLLKLRATKFELKPILKACANGSSEMMTNLSLNIVSMLYNLQLLAYAGESGIVVYGVIMYVNFVFISIFIGYAIGVAPLIGFNFGAKNKAELKNIFKKSMIIIGASALLMVGASVALNTPLSILFVKDNPELLQMTKHGFLIYSISFAIVGFNIFASGFFTALNNGLVSAILSFLRLFLYQTISVLVLPIFFGLDGIWFAVVAAEGAGLITSILFIIFNRKKYGYI